MRSLTVPGFFNRSELEKEAEKVRGAGSRRQAGPRNTKPLQPKLGFSTTYRGGGSLKRHCSSGRLPPKPFLSSELWRISETCPRC